MANEDCVDGMICQGQQCIMAPMPVEGGPEIGELIMTEFMSDPHNGLEDNHAEWIELMNVSNRMLDVSSCELADQGIVDGGASLPAALGENSIAPGGLMLVVRSEDPELNGGLTADATFGFGLSNGGDTLYLRCGGVVLDSIAFGGQTELQRRRMIAYGRSGDDLDGPSGEGTRWCEATNEYVNGHLGTPGRPNPVCGL